MGKPLVYRIEGQKEVLRKFRALEKKGARRAVRKAVRAGAAPEVKEAKRNAPRETGLLKKAIGLKFKSYRGGQFVLAVIGAKSRKDATTGRNPVKYVHLVDGGTKAHRIPRASRKVILKWTDESGDAFYSPIVFHPGTKPTQFMLRSFRNTRALQLRMFRSKFAVEVIAEARRG